MPAAKNKKAPAAGPASHPAVAAPAAAFGVVDTKKRKRKMDGPKFYAVRTGYAPGIYSSWPECQAQVTGFAGANYKSFPTREMAELYVQGKNPTPNSTPDRFYAVAVGSRPGIYTDWTEAQKAYTGVKRPKYKRFDTHEAAQAFMRQFGNQQTTFAVKTQPVEEEDEDEEDEDEEVDADDDDDEGLDILAGLDGLGGDEEDEKPAKKKARKELGLAPAAGNFIDVYTDGSSLGNGRAGPMAGVGVFFGAGDPRNIAERLPGEPQTNQRAELTAILRALQTVPLTQGVQIISDSKYAISCVTEWYVNWQKNGWRTHKGEVMNQDLVKAVLGRIEERNKRGGQTRFHWVKGHSGTPGNVEADRLAVAGSRMAAVAAGRRR